MLSRACGYLAALLVLGIAGLILAEIFCRTVLNISLSFAWEYAAYCFAVSIFLAAGVRAADGRIRQGDAALAERSSPPGVPARRRRYHGRHHDRRCTRVVAGRPCLEVHG